MTRAESPAQIFAATATRRPDLTFALAPASARLPWAPDGFRITYGEAAARVASLRDGYRDAGYGEGSRLALLLENRPDLLLHWLALNDIGASIVPLNGDMRPDELRHQMDVSGADAVIAAPGFERLLAAGLPDGTVVGGLETPPPPSRVRRLAGGGRAADEAALLFTSGSTGKPKACILSNGYFANLAEWYVSMPGVASMQADLEVALTPLPFFHMNALGCTALGMMKLGGAIVPLDRFHPDRWWQTVADSGATVLHALGVIPAILLQRPPAPLDRTHCARFTFAPGVDAAQRVAYEERFGLPIVDGWAMTETGGAGITETAGLDPVPDGRCVGRPVAGMEWRLVDDTGSDVALGMPGELIVRRAGPDPRLGFFSGYLGDPSATEAVWSGGWFHTGDVMRADPQGLLYFVDRRKSIIRRSGENISALEVEAALMADTAVTAAAVTPVSDPLREQEVFAFVVPNAEQPFSGGGAEGLLRRLSKKMSYFKLPGWLAVVDALPVSSTQKLQRGALRIQAEEAIAAGSARDLRRLKGQMRAREDV
jgi:acyl-coenzyme A synthetase/AMP-(fatty) acid ligase